MPLRKWKSALSSNGQYLAAGSEDNIYFFGTNSSVPLWGYRLKSTIIDLDISENGTFVAVTDQEGCLYYFHRTIVGSGIGVSSFPLIIYLIAICIIMRYTIKWSRNRDFF